MANAVEIRGLTRSFGETSALGGVHLDVEEGSVVALLGPNGAGKTTTVRILATLLRPDGGHATVAGYDVVSEPAGVRGSIGLTGQYTAVDGRLTGHENLELIGRLSQMRAREVRKHASQLLERFGLADAADRRVDGYSGGMARRLDIAASLVARPAILFLDEPTAGLDPRGRREILALIRELVGEGMTVLLTTQYLEEADQLADRIAVLDRGHVITEGTSGELKRQVAGRTLVLHLADSRQASRASEELRSLGAAAGPDVREEQDEPVVVLEVGEDVSVVAQAIRRLDDAGLELADLRLQRPTLDDVFLALTGHTPAAHADGDPEEDFQ